MTPRNIGIIVIVFLFLVAFSAFVFGSRNNTANRNGLASISDVGTTALPAPSTVPPPQYVTVPTAYYVSSPAVNTTATPTTRAKTASNVNTEPTKLPVELDPNYRYYRFNGNDYVLYYPNTPDHRAPRTAANTNYYPGDTGYTYY